MTTTEGHLTADEVDDALSYRLDDGAGEHLASCHACQITVEWKRLAKLGQLDELDTDWYCRSMAALAEQARRVGHGLVYAASQRSRSHLAWMAFETPPNVVIRIDSPEPLREISLSASLAPPLVDETSLQRIMRRVERGELSAVEAAQQLVLLGFDPEVAWKMAGRR